MEENYVDRIHLIATETLSVAIQPYISRCQDNDCKDYFRRIYSDIIGIIDNGDWRWVPGMYMMQRSSLGGIYGHLTKPNEQRDIEREAQETLRYVYRESLEKAENDAHIWGASVERIRKLTYTFFQEFVNTLSSNFPHLSHYFAYINDLINEDRYYY